VDHAKVATYGDILSGARSAGDSVAIIGAGGIGFDVAEFLVTPKAETNDAATFFDTWGVDSSFTVAGALKGDPLAPRPTTRKVTMLQRKAEKPGKSLGVSTGWILRNTLRKHGVEMLVGVSYDRIDDAGLHYTLDGKPEVLAVDTVVLCAGQESQSGLFETLQERGVAATMIGGAKEASELDALRAIDEGVRLAQSF
ncbi:MAG: FAD-dependent oxidoreductase, partial [Marinosulfonomonas sp.]|nr:FAD-dependent oxidoreductase [Marinosulfonomonas sp.]